MIGVATLGAIAHAALDLTGAGASGTINGGIFQQIDSQSTGTGVIEPFLRLKANGNEAGYNTDGTLGGSFDQLSGAWNYDLLLSSVPIKNLDTVSYYQFLLESVFDGMGIALRRRT